MQVHKVYCVKRCKTIVLLGVECCSLNKVKQISELRYMYKLGFNIRLKFVDKDM